MHVGHAIQACLRRTRVYAAAPKRKQRSKKKRRNVVDLTLIYAAPEASSGSRFQLQTFNLVYFNSLLRRRTICFKTRVKKK